MAGALTPLARRHLRLPRTLLALAPFASPLAAAILWPRSRRRDVLVCALYMWAHLNAYEMPGDEPAVLERRTLVTYPIKADRVLGLGEVPTVRLQRALAAAERTTPLDALLVWAHWLWFVVPNGTLAYLLLRAPDRFPAGAARLYATFEIGVVFYWLIPTAPPWYAAERGRLPAEPRLRRIMTEYGEAFWGRRWTSMYRRLAGNPLAAMPSLHLATAVVSAGNAAEVGALEGAVLGGYSALLAFALVYLGEHYLVDLVAGMALFGAVRALERPAGPLLEHGATAVAALRGLSASQR